jgi:hypothetical protein
MLLCNTMTLKLQIADFCEEIVMSLSLPSDDDRLSLVHVAPRAAAGGLKSKRSLNENRGPLARRSRTGAAPPMRR